MALKETTKRMHLLIEELTKDLRKTERGNQAAAQRVRTGSIKFAKLSKLYRKESIKTAQAGKQKTLRKKTAAKRRVKKKATMGRKRRR